MRETWVRAADLMLEGAWRYSTGSLINPPGNTSASGARSDGLEGFARTFLLAAFRIRGASGVGVEHLITRYTTGIRLGVNPASSKTTRWPSIMETPQARVEASSLAVALTLTRPYIWDEFDDATRADICAWLQPALTAPPYDNNWQLFSLVVAGFLRSVGRPAGTSESVERALTHIDQWYDGAGWYCDGSVTSRAYDSYNALALHYYPVLYGYLFDDSNMLHRYGSRLREFIKTFAMLFDANGAPMLYGRSLTYRFASVGALWLGCLTGYTPLAPGQTRDIATRCLQYFLDAGLVFDGYPPLGWFTADDITIQAYSGPSSPYWMAKAFVALLLPGDHLEWHCAGPPLAGDTVAPLGHTGVIAHRTAVDGIARIHNHGSDNYRSRNAAAVNDDPLYSQTAYSTRTAPAVRSPYSNAFGILVRGNLTQRGPITALAVGPNWASSRQAPHRRRRWIGTPRMDFPELRAHMPGVKPITGIVIDHITCCAGPLELRLWRVRGAAGCMFQISGWPLPHHDKAITSAVSPTGAHVSTIGLTTTLHNQLGFTTAALQTTPQRTPFGEYLTVATLSGPCGADTTFAATATLSEHPITTNDVVVHARPRALDITWPDGQTQVIPLPD